MGIPLSQCSKPAKVKPAGTVPPPADQEEYARSRPSLTKRQEVLLSESWMILQPDMQSAGAISFLALFEAHPEEIQLFNKFRKADPQSIRHCATFQKHAMIVMSAMYKAFTRLKEHDKMVLLLHGIGDTHREAGVKRRDLLLFIPFFIDAIKQTLKPWTLELEQAWTTYMKLLTHVMCERMLP